MNNGVDVKALLKMCSEDSRTQYQEKVHEAYIFTLSNIFSVKTAPEQQLLERHDIPTATAKN